jgi:hypothetical protein
MKRHVFFTGVILALILLPSIIQAGWARTYGSDQYDVGYCVEETADGGYILGVQAYPDPDSFMTVALIKTDEHGDTLWTQRSPGWSECAASSVHQTSDLGYIATGSLAYVDMDPLFLLKIDSNGDTLWNRLSTEWLPPDAWGRGQYVEQTSDGGYIITGNVHFYSSSTDLWLVKTDSAGDTVWTRTYGADGEDCGHCVRQTSDTGYIVCGYSTHEMVKYMWLLKTDSQGDTVWTTNLPWMEAMGSPGELYSVQETSDSGYVMTGYIAVTLDGKTHLCVYKTDSAGDSLWYRYDWDWFTDWDSTGGSGLSVKETSDTGLVITGHRSEFGVPITDLWLLKTDYEGNHLWNRTYGGSDEDMGNCVGETRDGGYIVVGATKSFGAGGFDIWLLKTDANGDTLAVVEEPVVSGVSSWYVLNPVGSRITLRYSDCPQGFHAVVFDATGRKVDEIHAAEASGTIAWGGKQKPGVYFIRPTSFQQTVTKKVVLIR